MQSPEVLAKLAILRAKAADGTLTLDDQREAITLMRGDRQAASATSAVRKRASAKAAIPSGDDLLDELKAL